MKAVVYTRVSTEDQAKEGYSLEVQREYLSDFAKRQNYEIFGIYQDDGISGYSLERPALKKLLADAKLKKFDLVLVYKLDRFSRRLKDLLNLVDELESCGVAFKSATEPFDTTTSAGKLMFQQLGSFAEFERNRIIERVFPGMVKGVEKGNWQGASYAPYGYRYNKEKKLLEVVPEEAEVIKRIYAMYLSDKSSPQIGGYLYQKGYKTRAGGYFTNHLVCNILKNPVYLGKIAWNRHHYDKKQKTPRGFRYVKNSPSKVIIAQGRHEPIISQEDFDKVQEKLARNRTNTNRRDFKSRYILTGILFCAKCGHKYRGASYTTNHRKHERKPWYKCSAREEHYIKCKNPAVRAEVIEPQVFQILERIATNRDVVKKRIQNVIKAQVEPDETTRERIVTLKAELRKNLTKQRKLNDLYLEGEIGIGIYKEKNASLRQEEEHLKKETAILQTRLIERERSREYLVLLQNVLANFDETKQDLSTMEKKNLLRLIFKWIKVENGHIKEYKLYDPFKSLLKKEEGKWQLKEVEALLKKRSQSCISRPSDAR